MDGSSRVGRDHPNRACGVLAAVLLALAACGADGGSGADATRRQATPPRRRTPAPRSTRACTTRDPASRAQRRPASFDLALPGPTIR
jgi:hypothetical protein